PHLTQGKALAFAHGFNIRFGFVEVPAGIDVLLIAPKAPGHTVRREFVAGRGIPDIVAVEQDATGSAWDLAMSYAKGIGGTRAGLDTLAEAGYQPEIAYFELLHELKLIVDLMHEGGIAKQRWSISDTAEFGDCVSGPRVVTDQVKADMKAILADIQDGSFAKKFIDDQDAGAPEFTKLREDEAKHEIETVGKELRKMFSWSAQSLDDDYTEGSAAR